MTLDHPPSPLCLGWSRLGCAPVLKCELCHADVFSSAVTSWPLGLSVLVDPPHPLPSPLPLCLLLDSSNRTSGVGAAEHLNKSGLMSLLLGSWIVGYTELHSTAAGGRAEPKYSFQGHRPRPLYAILIIYLTVPSKLDSFVLIIILIWWKQNSSASVCLHIINLIWFVSMLFFHSLSNWSAAKLVKFELTCSETRSVWWCSSYL